MGNRDFAQAQLRSARRSVLSHSFAALLAILFLLGVATFAHPASFDMCAGHTCLDGELGSADAKIITVPPHAIDTERERRWLERCQPTVVEDDFGVEYLRYKPGVVGCEFGKDR